jgi:epoxyqueuosine reductase
MDSGTSGNGSGLDSGTDPHELTERVVGAALALRFDRCAVAAVEDLPAAVRLQEWLSRDMHGSMHWMARNPERRGDPRQVLENARSVIMVALNYYTEESVAEDPRLARISRYAWGHEYHAVLGERLAALAALIEGWMPGASSRWYVDTGPVLEKAWAERAGIGWIGKHTNLITQESGSWLFLGALLTDLPLVGGSEHADRCGTCQRCIGACPTAAIVAPYVLDARLCISYLTIENRGPIPEELRRAMGNRVFGCDDCQDVCPWNRFAHPTSLQDEFSPRRELRAAALAQLLGLNEREFKEKFRDSPVLRARREGFARNVAVALGNSGDPEAVPALRAALGDPAPLVRGHAAWALGEIVSRHSIEALEACLETERHPEVRAEAEGALQRLISGPPKRHPPTSNAC